MLGARNVTKRRAERAMGAVGWNPGRRMEDRTRRHEAARSQPNPERRPEWGTGRSSCTEFRSMYELRPECHGRWYRPSAAASTRKALVGAEWPVLPRS